jgi:DNA-binding NarL/FixJ family response regulator
VTGITVALVDDHPIVLAGVRALLKAACNIDIVGEATTAREAMRVISERAPDVAIIDISLPDLSGIELAKAICSSCPTVKVLGLTIHEDPSYLELLLQSGARGYMLKRSAAEELLKAIRTVAQGQVYIDPALGDGTAVDCRPDTTKASDADLSPREREVLQLTGKGYSNKEIASLISVGIKSVETYKARAAEKLGLRTRSEIVRYAVSQGWLNADLPRESGPST